MPLGDAPAGGNPAGLGAAQTPPAPRLRTAPRALDFDPATRDFTLNPDGTYLGVHPVDHHVRMALLVEFRSVPSAPEDGNTLRQMAIAGDAAMTEDASARVQAVLKDLISAGDITLISVTANAHPRWRANVKVIYSNNRLPGSEPRTVST